MLVNCRHPVNDFFGLPLFQVHCHMNLHCFSESHWKNLVLLFIYYIHSGVLFSLGLHLKHCIYHPQSSSRCVSCASRARTQHEQIW